MDINKSNRTRAVELLREGVDIWERLPEETEEQFRTFEIFRDLGPDRTVTMAAELAGRNRQYLVKLSKEMLWEMRTAAFDKYIAYRMQRIQDDARKEMAFRHASQAMDFQRKAVQRLAEIDPHDLSPNETLKFFETAVRIERTALGEADSTVRVEAPEPSVDSSQHEWDSEALAQIIATLGEAGILAGSGDSGESTEIIEAEVIEDPGLDDSADDTVHPSPPDA